MEGKSYFRGIPTKIDVDRIIEQFGIPEEGTEIDMKDIAKVIRVEKRSYRFSTVVTAWKKRLFREHNILMVATGEGSYRAAAPDERIDYSTRKVSSGRRAIGRAIVIAHSTDAGRLSEAMQTTAKSIVALNESKMRLAAGVMPK